MTMERQRRDELVAELEVIARTGGADTVEALKKVAGALVEALGPSDHEQAVAELTKKHGTKTPESHTVGPLENPAGLAARGRDVSKEDLEAEQQEKDEQRRARLERADEDRVSRDRVNMPDRERTPPEPHAESDARERQKEEEPVS